MKMRTDSQTTRKACKSEDKPERIRKTSGPKAIDSYASDESSLLLLVLTALGVLFSLYSVSVSCRNCR